MRPVIGNDNSPADPLRPRKLSNVGSASAGSERDTGRSHPITTFFLSREPDAVARPSSTGAQLSSLHDTIQESDQSIKHASPRHVGTSSGRSGSRRRSTIRPGNVERMLRRGSSGNSAISDTANKESSTYTPSKRDSTPPPQRPDSQDPSLPNSPRSLHSRASRRSLPKSTSSGDDLLTNADETSSQAVLSSGDEDENEPGDKRRTENDMEDSISGPVHDSQPELIMPSIKMPSRRPFTEGGKRLGRFKIMVAGRKGTIFLGTPLLLCGSNISI
jgi:hypothetical protein